MGSAREYLDGLFDYLMTALSSLPLVTVIGDPPERLPVVSIAVSGVAAEQVVQRLADNAILAVGNPTSRVLDLIGVDEIGGVLTLGLAHYSTMAEVDHLVRTLASLG
jgi:selenocysteine lyase/cysteine desulfurase